MSEFSTLFYSRHSDWKVETTPDGSGGWWVVKISTIFPVLLEQRHPRRGNNFGKKQSLKFLVQQLGGKMRENNIVPFITKKNCFSFSDFQI